MCTSEKLNLAGLIEWRSKVWVKRLDVHWQKLEPRAFEAVFMGYNDELKGYRVYWQSDTAQIEGKMVTQPYSVLRLQFHRKHQTPKTNRNRLISMLI